MRVRARGWMPWLAPAAALAVFAGGLGGVRSAQARTGADCPHDQFTVTVNGGASTFNDPLAPAAFGHAYHLDITVTSTEGPPYTNLLVDWGRPPFNTLNGLTITNVGPNEAIVDGVARNDEGLAFPYTETLGVKIQDGGFCQFDNGWDVPFLAAQPRGSVLPNLVPPQPPPNDCPPCQVSDPVTIANGEFTQDVVDLRIPGRGLDFAFERVYRSGVNFFGPLGFNWDFSYDRRLIELNADELSDARGQFAAAKAGDVERVGAFGVRADLYVSNPDGSYTSPAGVYSILTKQPDGSFVERDPDGTAHAYGIPDQTSGIAPLTSIADRNGNWLSFVYTNGFNLSRVVDALGRAITFQYNPLGEITSMTDFTGRVVQYGYGNANEDLTSVTSPAVTGTPNGNDFPSGRTTHYSYIVGNSDQRLNHDLTAIQAPNDSIDRERIAYDTTAGSPTFDRVLSQDDGGGRANVQSQVPAGGTTHFAYASLPGNPSDPNSAVSQTTVTDRNGNQTLFQLDSLGAVLLRRQFFNRHVDPSSPDHVDTTYSYDGEDRLVSRTDPAGDATTYGYDSANPDRRRQGNLLAVTRQPDATRGGDQTQLKTTYSYEPIFGEVRTVTDPRGTDASYVPPNGGPRSAARYTTTNRFDYEEACDFAAIGAKIGVSAAQAKSLLSAAGMCSSPAGDLNGDGVTTQVGGNVVLASLPSVRLATACAGPTITQATHSCSQQARLEGVTTQPIVQKTVFNRFGQRTRTIDPEANVTTYDYYSERDPNGDGTIENPSGDPTTGGYLRLVTRDAAAGSSRDSKTDPTPTSIRTQYSYNEVGDRTREVDGRGIATDYVYNQLDEPVQIKRASAHGVFSPDPAEPQALTDFAYLERFFYDSNGNVVEQQVEDRGNTSSVDGNPPSADRPTNAQNPDPAGGPAFVDTVYKYDLLDDRVEALREVKNGSGAVFLRTRFRYDANQNRVLTIEPAGNASSSIYDERDLPYQRTAGATAPPVAALLGSSDPTSYSVRGGTPATTTEHHDANGNLAEVDSPLGHRTRFVYDGFDRRTSVVDGVGDQTVFQYDPAGNRVRTVRFGPVGGPSPGSPGPDPLPQRVSSAGSLQPANLVSTSLLSATATRFDELSRPYEIDRSLFVHSQSTVRPADVRKGGTGLGAGKIDLDPSDKCSVPGLAAPPSGWLGCVAGRTEFDRSSRPTFRIADDGTVARTLYDGADRPLSVTDPAGNVLEYAYDDDGNVIETRRTDVASAAGVPNELFLATSFYDSLDRLQETVDNLGQTTDHRYDSRGDLVATADANGPAGPPISRRAFPDGSRTVDTTNAFGNVTRDSYDGLGRLTQSQTVLTAGGRGDGVHIGATVFGAKASLPLADKSQGGGDGLITQNTSYDADSLVSQRFDDNGNRTSYAYDDLDRRVTETKGACSAPHLADRCDPPTSIAYAYDVDSNLTGLTEETGSVLQRAFDNADRLVGVSVTRAAGVVGTTAQGFEYDGLSRQTRSTDGNDPASAADDSVVSVSYDSLGRQIEERQTIGTNPAAVVDDAFRADGLRSKLTYPNARAKLYTYDPDERLVTVADSGAGSPIATYDFVGSRVLRRRFANGTQLTFLNDAGTADTGYDGLGRPVELRHLAPGGALLLGFQRAYDRVGSPLTTTRTHTSDQSEAYTYDSARRLLTFNRGVPSGGSVTPDAGTVTPVQRAFTLDGVGDWKQVDSETRKHSSFDEVISRTDGPTTTAIQSDANGNTTDPGTFTYAYDAFDRLVSATRKSDSAVATYAYDALGRRIQKSLTGFGGGLDGTTQYYSGRGQEIEERSGTTVKQQYVYGRGIDEPLVLDRGSTRLYFHQDPLGSVEGLTDTTGKLVEGYLYDAYGHQTVFQPGPNGTIDWGGDDLEAPTSALGNPFLFTGRRLDPETGTYYYRARNLDPDLGRFLQRDPVGVWGDPAGLGNGYAYAGDSPASAGDPAGMGGEPDVAGELLAAFTRPQDQWPALRDLARQEEEARREGASMKVIEQAADRTVNNGLKFETTTPPSDFADTGNYDDGHAFGWNTSASSSPSVSPRTGAMGMSRMDIMSRIRNGAYASGHGDRYGGNTVIRDIDIQMFMQREMGLSEADIERWFLDQGLALPIQRCAGSGTPQECMASGDGESCGTAGTCEPQHHDACTGSGGGGATGGSSGGAGGAEGGGSGLGGGVGGQAPEPRPGYGVEAPALPPAENFAEPGERNLLEVA